MSLDTEVALGAGDTVLYENPDPPRKGHSPPPLLARVYCGQMAGWIRIPLGTEVGLGAGDIVLYADTAPSTERGTSAPTFRPCLLWPNGWMHQNTTWYGGRPQPRRHCVRWGAPPKGTAPSFLPMPILSKRLHISGYHLVRRYSHSLGYIVTWGLSSPPLKGHSPQFSANVRCGHANAAECTKMPLGMEVGLGPGDFVFDGDPCSSHRKRAEPHPIFGPCPLWPNGWMDQDVTWYGGRPRPRRHCVRWGPASPSPRRGRSLPPQFSAHVYCGQTAGWIKMTLGMEVGLGPGHIVLDGTQHPPQKGAQPPIFGQCLLRPNAWMD